MVTRVLHLIKGLGPGGAEQLLVNQAGVDVGDDLEFHVAYLVSWKNHHVGALRAAGWKVHCVRSDRPYDVRWLWRLRQLVLKEKVDVIHGHSPLVSALTRLVLRTLPRGRRPASIYTEHNEWGRHQAGTRRLNQATIGMEDHVIAVSDGVRASMPSELDVEVLLHGIDVEAVAGQLVHRDEVRAELGISPDEIVIGTVANFRREKAYDVMLEAAAMVIEQRPEVRFVSVGQGPLEQEIRAHHARLGLGDRFLLLGYRDDATRVMSAFDIFTLSSHHEGLPVSLMDALALGLPVVATAVGGTPGAVEGVSSRLVRPGSVGELGSAYLDMAQDLDNQGCGEAAERFDVRRTQAALVDRYHSMR